MERTIGASVGAKEAEGNVLQCIQRLTVVRIVLLTLAMSSTTEAKASDFNFLLGLIIGSEMTDSNQIEEEPDERSTSIVFDENGESTISKVETFDQTQWRSTNDKFFICPGIYKDYFKHSCRSYQRGIRGFLELTAKGEELPLIEALETREGSRVVIDSIELDRKSKLVVRYKIPRDR